MSRSRIGRMRSRARFLVPTEQSDGGGGRTTVYEPAGELIPCDYRPMTADRQLSQETDTVMRRAKATLRAACVPPGFRAMRIQVDGQEFGILSDEPPTPGRRFMTLILGSE